MRKSPDDDGMIYLVAPKPGDGKKLLLVTRSDQANLFEIFTELKDTRFDFLDPHLDLNDAERSLLAENGMLLDASAEIKKPLFRCNLSEVEPFTGEIDRESLLVNQSFRYEPFDLSKFALLANERNFSPYSSSAWIRNPITDIESGYWLDSAEAAVVSTFTANASLSDNLDENLARRLLSAGLIDTLAIREKASEHWSEIVEKVRHDFAHEKYAVIPALFQAEQMQAMREYYRQYVDQGFMPFGDSQVAGRYREHSEPFASFLHGQLTNLMTAIVGEEIKLSYVFASSYKEGALLDPHVDREQCEYSISFQVDYEPEPLDHLSPWAIYIEPLTRYYNGPPGGKNIIPWEELESHKSGIRPKPIHLASGDGLIYKGRELVHYRYALPAGQRSTSLFFHFVPKDFDGGLH